MPQGWFELSRISSGDRIEFVREFWMMRLPYHPALKGVREFFDKLDDVGVVVSRQNQEEPWRSELVYSLRDNSTFFRGLVPASDGAIDRVRKQLGIALPRDFLAFVRLHNGFGKLTEIGLMPIESMQQVHQELVGHLVASNHPLRSKEGFVDPESLYPFYEEFGLGCQCFYSDWYPESEMGNVYFSSVDYIISDTTDRRSWSEQLAYLTFLNWLSAFLSGMGVAP
jgi:hypothetical protein